MYIGIDLGGTNIKLGLLADDLSVVDRLKVPTESETNSETVMANLSDGIQQLFITNHISANDIQTIGIGVPGQMDIQKGLSIFSPNFSNWANVPVAQLIADEFQTQTVIDNDVRVNLYGEWQFGAGRRKQDVLMVTLGTGFGAAVIAGGKMQYGRSDSAGEMGHMSMHHHGRPCACGNKGCLGRYVSARGMLWTVRDHLEAGETTIMTDWVDGDVSRLTAHMISQAYDEGDSLAKRVMQETGEEFGYGLANAINLYNPERIIVGGGVAQAGERLMAPAEAIVATHALKTAREACDIVMADLGPWAGMIGAGVYAKLKSNGQLN